MSVDREEVERIAALAHLHFDEAEVERLTAEMNQILEHADALRGVDEPSAQIASSAAPDAASPPYARPEAVTVPGNEGLIPPDPLAEEFLARRPHVEDGFFVVPPPPGVERES